MKILRARFGSKEEFREGYLTELPFGGLFVPTMEKLQIGEPVVAELTCDGLPNKVCIRATVHSWNPPAPRQKIRGGARVAFLPGEHEKVDFVLDAIGGKRSTQKRRYTRIPVQIPVRFRQVDAIDLIDGMLWEIAIGGALLKTAKPPPLGSDLVVSLRHPGGAGPVDLEGKVGYLTPDGGVGVIFSFRDGGGARRLRELIRRYRGGT